MSVNERILDTMTVSFLMKGEEVATERLAACRRDEVFLPQPVIAEISFGLERMPDSRRKAQLLEDFHSLLLNLRRCEWTDDVSSAFGKTKAYLQSQGTPVEDFDIAIAAHALARGAVLVSHNNRHMERIPELRLESWK